MGISTVGALAVDSRGVPARDALAERFTSRYSWMPATMVKLARMWKERPGVLAWYDRVRSRPSFKAAVDDWLSPVDIERYANAPDPWLKVQGILQAA